MSGSDQRQEGTTDDDGVADSTAERTETAGSSVPSSSSGSTRDPRVILDEMLTSIDLIQRYTQGITFKEFAEQQVLQDAVALRIAILGEAASHLPESDKVR